MQAGKKKVVQTEKRLDIGIAVCEVHVVPEKYLMVACLTNGEVCCYNVLYFADAVNVHNSYLEIFVIDCRSSWISRV